MNECLCFFDRMRLFDYLFYLLLIFYCGMHSRLWFSGMKLNSSYPLEQRGSISLSSSKDSTERALTGSSINKFNHSERPMYRYYPVRQIALSVGS